MAATSVTGTGLGSAVGKQKGSEHLSVGAEKIIGPRVVYAGLHTLPEGEEGATTELVINLPKLPGVEEDYIVVVTPVAATAVSAVLEFEGEATLITITSDEAVACNVAVVKAGLAV
jgi:hypothetical protein